MDSPRNISSISLFLMRGVRLIWLLSSVCYAPTFIHTKHIPTRNRLPWYFRTRGSSSSSAISPSTRQRHASIQSRGCRFGRNATRWFPPMFLGEGWVNPAHAERWRPLSERSQRLIHFLPPHSPYPRGCTHINRYVFELSWKHSDPTYRSRIVRKASTPAAFQNLAGSKQTLPLQCCKVAVTSLPWVMLSISNDSHI